VAEKKIPRKPGSSNNSIDRARPFSTIIGSGVITTTTTLVNNAQIHMIISAERRKGSVKTISRRCA
jgi:hypothetical protein